MESVRSIGSFLRAPPIDDSGSSSVSLTGEPHAEANAFCPSLTFSERVFGFLVCFFGGMVVSTMAFGSFGAVFIGKPFTFAVGYTLGNLLSLCSTFFLVGPTQQFQNMTDKKRLTVSLVYVTSLMLSLACCFVAPNRLLILVLVGTQCCSLLWYSLSYIPYGRSVATRVLGSFV
eukprot:Selendium_serpulae@DN1785_c0_g1_i1.p1